MKLILKIAAGVFLGIALFLGVLYSLGLIERAKQLADAKKRLAEESKRLDEKLAPLAIKDLADLTPEILVAHCGKPKKDEIMQVSAKLNSRDLSYQVATDRTIEVLFSDDTGRWTLATFSDIHHAPFRVDGALTGFTEQSAMRAMPCLKAKEQ